MTNALMTLPKTTFPAPTVNYRSLDIIGNTIGKYFDYKRVRAEIGYEIERLHSQKEIILKQIDAELAKSFDANEKHYKLEKKRIKVISQQISGYDQNLSRVNDAVLSNLNNPEVLNYLKGYYRELLLAKERMVLSMGSFDPNYQVTQGV